MTLFHLFHHFFQQHVILQFQYTIIFGNNLDSVAMLEAVPPTWKVRNVSCVPGSPIDCAAITPTASPFSTILPVAKITTITFCTNTLTGFTGQHGTNFNRFNRRILQFILAIASRDFISGSNNQFTC